MRSKHKDEFLSRTYLFVFVFVLVGLVLLLNSLYDSRSAGLPAIQVKAFSGGRFEASGVAYVPGTTGVLFIDDDRPDKIFWMQLGEDRFQSGPIKPIKLGASVIDLEGITNDGSSFYIVGSQSKATGGDLTGLVRFKFDANTQAVTGVESVSGLKKFLADNVAELHGFAETRYEDGGINVEGIAWDPNTRRLLLGLRSPVIDGQALVVPLKLRNPQATLSPANLEVEGKKAIRLPLADNGIRSIEYNERRKTFYILTGAAANYEKADFKLWEWDGNASSPTLRATETFDRKLKPEGITRYSANGKAFTFIVFDTSGYAAMD
jgi:hypothetical protein